MLGLFSIGQVSTPAEPTPEPITEDVTVQTPCCTHCRLRQSSRLTPAEYAGRFVEQPRQRIRFEPDFEAEGERLVLVDRQAHDRLRTLMGEHSRLERLLRQVEARAGSALHSGPSRFRPSPDEQANTLRAYQRDVTIAKGQLAYADRTWRKARAELQAHRAERRAREQQLAAQVIAERDERRAAEREAAGLPPPDDIVERFTFRAHPRQMAAGLRGPHFLN